MLDAAHGEAVGTSVVALRKNGGRLGPQAGASDTSGVAG